MCAPLQSHYWPALVYAMTEVSLKPDPEGRVTYTVTSQELQVATTSWVQIANAYPTPE